MSKCKKWKNINQKHRYQQIAQEVFYCGKPNSQYMVMFVSHFLDDR